MREKLTAELPGHPSITSNIDVFFFLVLLVKVFPGVTWAFNGDGLLTRVTHIKYTERGKGLSPCLGLLPSSHQGIKITFTGGHVAGLEIMVLISLDAHPCWQVHNKQVSLACMTRVSE